MDGGAIDKAAAGLTAAVDALLCAPFEGLASPVPTRLMCDLEVQRRRLAGVDQRLIAALATSGAVLDSGSSSLADLVSALTRCSRGEARARVGRSVDLGPRRAVSGERLEPVHPITAAAVAAGWHVIMRHGVPWWIPPAWLDPYRTPIRNTTRHLPAIDFGQLDTVLRT